MRHRSVISIGLFTALAMACTPATGGTHPAGAGPPSIAASEAADPDVAVAPSLPAALPALIPGACPLTRPEPAFIAPPPFPAKPPAYYESDWYGRPALWTMLSLGGEAWAGLPRGPGGLGQKTFWWSADWRPQAEPTPDITVVGRQLDGAGRFEIGGPGTNATADFGTAMLIGVAIPTPGCWELTAEYRGAMLCYTVLVRP